MAWHRHHYSSSIVWLYKVCRQYWDGSVCQRVDNRLPQHVRAVDFSLDLDRVVLMFQRIQRLSTDYPFLAVDISLNITRVRIDPDIGHAKNGLWTKSCSRVDFSVSNELYDVRSSNVGFYSSLDVHNPYRVLVVGTPRDRMGSLRDESVPVQPSEVPLDEPVVQSICGREFSAP